MSPCAGITGIVQADAAVVSIDRPEDGQNLAGTANGEDNEKAPIPESQLNGHRCMLYVKAIAL